MPTEPHLYDRFARFEFDFEPRLAPRSTAEIQYDIFETRAKFPKGATSVKALDPLGKALLGLYKELEQANERAKHMSIHISHD